MKNDLPEIAALEALLREQREAYLRAPYPAWDNRAAHLKALRSMLLDNREALAVPAGTSARVRPPGHCSGAGHLRSALPRGLVSRGGAPDRR